MLDLFHYYTRQTTLLSWHVACIRTAKLKNSTKREFEFICPGNCYDYFNVSMRDDTEAQTHRKNFVNEMSQKL